MNETHRTNLNGAANRTQQIIIFACLLALITLASGCASAIYGSGKDGDVLREGSDRAVLANRFGEPIRCGTDKYGRAYEVFRAEGKIVPDKESVTDIQVFEILFWPAEPIFVSEAIIIWPFEAIGKKDVSVYFDRYGNYKFHEVHQAKSK
jgi:hypothetical protein